MEKSMQTLVPVKFCILQFHMTGYYLGKLVQYINNLRVSTEHWLTADGGKRRSMAPTA